jgi:hypothetical protein
MAQAGEIIMQNPSILFVTFLHAVVSIGFTIIFGLMFVAIEVTGKSRALYLYVLFSYFWTIFTLGYVLYLTISRLSAFWYFLNGTEFFPEYPVLKSLARACTKSLGSASLAGFLLAVVNFLQAIVRSMGSSNNAGMAILRCLALCILAVLEWFIRFMNRYGLIYCAVFGVPFREGCRRWTELICHRFVDVIMGGCVVSTALTYNEILFSVGAGLIGLALGLFLGDIWETDAWGLGILMCVLTVFFTFGIFELFSNPILVSSDTLLVCFAEAPERLKTTASDLYDKLKQFYGKHLRRKLAV